MFRLASVILAVLIGSCPLACGASTIDCGHCGTSRPGPSHHHSESTADNCVCEGALRADDLRTLSIELVVCPFYLPEELDWSQARFGLADRDTAGCCSNAAAGLAGSTIPRLRC
ncbi:MAG: hypothetical protein KatS3mg108_1198 [Isosphaeraceae bacterium]|nr:MAG: hypothetical protein KatS3mg108_1198 [Isosphaeraceae bacterium]